MNLQERFEAQWFMSNGSIPDKENDPLGYATYKVALSWFEEGYEAAVNDNTAASELDKPALTIQSTELAGICPGK